jgi:hypothetical protein
MYNIAWYTSILSHLKNSKIKVIGWDFISHHPRPIEELSRQGLIMAGQQKISIKLQRRYFDLGSLLLHASLYGARGEGEFRQGHFLPLGPFTTDIFARDYFAIMKAIENVSSEEIILLHQVLMFHQ